MTGFGGGGPWRDRARGSSWRAGAAGVVAGVQQAADSVFDAVDRWTDPRAREVRRRKRLRQRGIRYSVVSTAGSGAAVGLALLSAPMWEVAVVSGGSGIVVFAAARTVQQYRRARTSPLPPAPPPRGPLPPNGSAARHPMARLAKAERAMHELRRATAASNSVAAEHVRDTAATAESGSAALRAMAGDVVAMERAAEVAPAQTRPALTAAIARLDAGVADYEAMIAAAVEVISLAGEGVHRGGHDIRDDIRHATDRLRGLAEGLAHFRNDP